MWNSNTTTAPIHTSSTSTSSTNVLNNNNNNSMSNQPKHDIFVGNLAFSTTEEQIQQAFSEIGQVIKVRMVSDIETGKPRGFAFVEFEDPQAALAAIRNMNDYELNGRKLRVNFSNSSHLETLAGQLGMDLSSVGSTGGGGVLNAKNKDVKGGASASSGGEGIASMGTATATGASTSAAASAAAAGLSASNELGTQAIANALKNMTKGEMYDIISQFKLIADQNPEEARRIISSHPQLPEAILYLMSQLDMIKAPLHSTAHGAGGGSMMVAPPMAAVGGSMLPPTGSTMAMGTTTGMAPPPPPVGIPGRMVAPPPPPTHVGVLGVPPSTPTTGVVVGGLDSSSAAAGRVDPRMAAVGGRQDPRMAMSGGGGGGGAVRQDPRAAAAAAAATGVAGAVTMGTMSYGQPGAVAQSQQQKVMPPMMGVAGLDPSLVQQVMGLTQAQIQQLPLEKQSSILALRQQIANAMSAMGGGVAGGGGGGGVGGGM